MGDAVHARRLRSLLMPLMEYLRSEDYTTTICENLMGELSHPRRDLTPQGKEFPHQSALF